jgi:hypothetical protein
LTIICFNTNEWLGLYEENYPKFIADVGAIHMPLTKEDVIFTLNGNKENFRATNKTGSFYMRRNFPYYNDPFMA